METILLIDDDAARCRQLATALIDAGYDVVAVRNPAESPSPDVPVALLLNGLGYREAKVLLQQRSQLRVVHLSALGQPLSPDIVVLAVREALCRPARKAVVLVVDDQQPIRRLISDFLTPAGYEILEADNGSHGIDLVRQRDGRVDLVITDLVMPSAGGLDLTADLTREYPAMKVLYISGYTGSIAMEVIARRTPQSVLSKPFTEEALLERVAILLKDL